VWRHFGGKPHSGRQEGREAEYRSGVSGFFLLRKPTFSVETLRGKTSDRKTGGEGSGRQERGGSEGNESDEGRGLYIPKF
jgi:hypothetical protein